MSVSDGAGDRDLHHRTFWVTEEAPPTWPPWACEGRNFDSADEAVAWALPLARTVIVKTRGGSLFYAGEPPSDIIEATGAEVSPWPPSAQRN
jgi:hypothetical protein